jgi:hypothetical protein
MPTPGLKLTIRASDPSQKVQVRAVADKLGRLQSALLHVGDYLTGNDFRTRGGSTELVRRRCTLLISEVRMGSFEATLELEPFQPTASGGPSLGEESIHKLREVVALVESENAIESKVDQSITEPRHRTRILKDLRDLWPEEEDKLDVEVGFDGAPQSRLTPPGKLVLEGLLSRQRNAEQVSVKGVLGTVHILPGDPFFRITGPDGRVTCRMSEEQREDARTWLGKPAIVYGQAEFDSAGNVRQMTSVDRIEPFRELTLQRLLRGDDELVLRIPVAISIDFRDSMWVSENEDLGIVCVSEDYDECLQNFQDEFFFAWKEYGSADDSTLTVGARDLKRALTHLVRGDSH